MNPAILVAGIGNIFLGDDAFGVEVVRSLVARGLLPQGVSVRDFGIRGFDLAYALLDPWDVVILIDALPRGETAGTLFVVEPNLDELGGRSAEMAMNPHGMDPVRVLGLAASMGTLPAKVLVVGCEPHDFGDELEGRMGLSAQVAAVVEEACSMVEGLVARFVQNGQRESGKQHPMQLETMER